MDKIQYVVYYMSRWVLNARNNVKKKNYNMTLAVVITSTYVCV